MKTEMKTAYVSLRGFVGFCTIEPEFDISFKKQESDSHLCHASLLEVEIAVPVLTKKEKHDLMNGAEIESLQKMKETLQAETHRKLMQIDERIGQLQALENKES